MRTVSRPRALLVALAAAAALLPAPVRAERFFLPLEREGPWLASDKTLHFVGSFAIAASWRVEGRSEGEAAAYTLSLGVAKEIYDATLKPSRLGRGASRKDLVVDVLGTAAGILCLRAIDR
jgi:uncharacterized protein YfiM (DUF2279 family)